MKAGIWKILKLDVSVSFNPDLFRFCTKLVAALAIASGYRDLISTSGIPSYLHGNGAWSRGLRFAT